MGNPFVPVNKCCKTKNPDKSGLGAEEEVLEPYSTSADYQYFMIGKFLYSPENSPNRLTANL